MKRNAVKQNILLKKSTNVSLAIQAVAAVKAEEQEDVPAVTNQKVSSSKEEDVGVN